MLTRIKTQYAFFPGNFWALMAASFIDRMGGALIAPFFAIYVTSRFNVGLTTVGLLFAIFTAANLIGGALGGALADKYGRRFMIIFGLVLSGFSSLLWGFVDRLEVFYLIAAFVGLLDSTGRPAQQAMVADILPEEKGTQGYGMWRVVTNLAITFGPLIGGFVIGRASYVALFIGDGISSLITASIVFAKLPETKPESAEGELGQGKTIWQTFRGYREVVRDTMFISLIFTVALMNTVYIQMHSTLPVWLTNINGYPANTFGNLLAMNAGMVVLFQFWVARRVSKRQPFLVMALGAMLYGIGFGMYGFVDGLLLFAAAMVVITIGEMVFMPVFQATIAKMAPEDMRGRYMGFATLIWAIPSGIGPSLAGLVVDNYNPNWVWYGAVILSLIAALGYLSLHARAKKRLATAPAVLTESAAD